MRRLLIALVLCVLPSHGWAAQNVLQTDTFGGTEAANVTAYDAGWVLSGSATVNQCKIRGTPGIGTTANICGVHDTRQTWTDDQWGELLLDATNVAGAKVGITLRMVVDGANKPNAFFCGFSSASSKYVIAKYTAGVYALILAGSNTIATGDTVNCEVVGQHVKLVITRSAAVLETIETDDASFSTGSPGILIHDTTSNRLAGSWRAGSVTADAVIQSFSGFLGAILP